MKIKCYDKYKKQHLIISPIDDSINIDCVSSNHSSGNVLLYFEIDDEYYKNHPDEYAEDPSPERWSDLKNVELVQ